MTFLEMSHCVPSWDLEDINPIDHDVFKLDYETAELTWENGELTMHELSARRVPSKSQPTATWDKARATETLEAIVNQATQQPYCKPQVTVNEDELVPWLHHDTAAGDGGVNASATLTSDALVPSSNNRLNKSVRDAGCSTRVGSCSGNPSAFFARTVTRGGGTAAASHDWSSCQDQSVSKSGTFGTFDTYDADLGGRRLSSTSTGSPENTSSGKDCSKSTSPDDSFGHCRTEHEKDVKEKKRGRTKPSISNKRRRTAATHNQSERKRRDKINQRMKTLQKLVPNSSKTDKASMLDEVIDHVKQLQAQAHMMSKMNMPSMMMPLAIQQQQMQMSMMSSMGMGMGMGFGMGIGSMDMNTIRQPNIPTGFHPSFMHMPSWNGHTTDHVANTTTMANDPMSAFLAYRSQPMNMDAYNRMAALYQHLQNQPSGQHPKN